MKITLFAALVCAAAPALAVPVSVKVVGPDNQPLSEAKLSSFETTFIFDEVPAVIPQVGVAGVFAWDWDGDFADKRAVGKKPFLRVRVEAPGLAPQFQVIRKSQTTIQLQPTRSWGGIVYGEDQQPLAGAKVTLGTVSPALEEIQKADDELLGAFIPIENSVATTDSNGRWTIAGVPLRGRATVTFSAPNYVQQQAALTIGEGDAVPIYGKMGGSITGVLLDPDGQPIAGETVRAGFGSNVQTKTDADGRFTLKGVAPGRSIIYVGEMFFGNRKRTELPPYLFDNKARAQVEAGVTADVGEIKALKGLLVKARVVGADTKLPLPDARFRMGYNYTESFTSADGEVSSRILPAPGRGGFDRPKVENEGYVDHDFPPALFDTKDETLDLGTISLERGIAVTGTVRVEGVDAATAVRAPGLSLSRNGNYDLVSVDDAGKFSSKVLGAGSYNVNLNSAGQDWQIVSPRSVSVPEWGKEFKPIEVVVKRLTPVLPAIKSARGRVTDAQNQGVAGVTINVRMQFEGGGSYSNAMATTDTDGAFEMEARAGNGRVIGVEVEGATHPNYLIGGSAEVKVVDGIATISGLVAKKRGAIFAGLVTGTDGKPAPNAWVGIVEAREYEPVQTGADGTFQLADVPLDKFTLLAARGSDWAKRNVGSEQSGLTLQLQNAPAAVNSDADRKRALEQIMAIKSGVQSDELFGAWNVLGADNVERYIRRNGEPAPGIMALFGAELVRRDPAQLLRRAPEMLDKATGETRENLEAQINLLRAGSDDAGERTDANAWLDEQKQVKREIKPRSVTQLLQMAAVAAKLQRADAAQWLDYAAAVAAQLGAGTRGQSQSWAAPLASLGYESAKTMVEGRSVTDEFKLWADLSPALAKTGDFAGAKSALSRLETLARDPEIIKGDTPNNWETSPRRLDYVRQSLARTLAPTQPAAAFELAEIIKDEFTKARAMLQVAGGAQSAGDVKVAEKALRLVMNANVGNVEYFAQAAAIAALFDAKLGAEFFAIAREKALPKRAETSFSPPSIGQWAFYHAPYDAAQSRVLIEREWDWRLPAALKTKNDSFSQDFNAIYDLVKGMAAVDGARAAEMQVAADAIQTKNYGREMSQFAIAIVALSSAAERAKLGLNSQY